MNEKSAYLMAGLIIYFIGGVVISYIGNSSIDWSFVLSWAIFMTIADFLILRKLKEKWKRKKDSNIMNNER